MEKKLILIRCFIIVLFLFIFRFINVTHGTILAVALSIFFIYKYDEKINDELNKKNNMMKLKLSSIEPKPKSFENRNEIIDFLFSIQDMYKYNQQAYEEIIEKLDSFFYIYERVMNGEVFKIEYFKIAIENKSTVLNNLHSMIYNIPISMDNKLNKAIDILEDLLNNYINEMEEKINNNDNINSSSQLINKGPKPFNEKIDKTPYTFNLY